MSLVLESCFVKNGNISFQHNTMQQCFAEKFLFYLKKVIPSKKVENSRIRPCKEHTRLENSKSLID